LADKFILVTHQAELNFEPSIEERLVVSQEVKR